jgi:hypothetical protein
MDRQDVGEVFLKASTMRSSCRRMARARALMREAKFLRELSDIALVIVDAEAGRNRDLQVDAPPAYDTVRFQVRAGFDNRHQFRQLRCR